MEFPIAIDVGIPTLSGYERLGCYKILYTTGEDNSERQVTLIADRPLHCSRPVRRRAHGVEHADEVG